MKTTSSPEQMKEFEMEKTLIVVDMQNDFVTGSLGTPEAQAIVPKVRSKIEECRAGGYNIFFTQDTHYNDPEYLNSVENYSNSLEGKYLPVMHCIDGTFGWQLIDEINYPVNSFEIIKKFTFGYKDWEYDIGDWINEKEYGGNHNTWEDDLDPPWCLDNWGFYASDFQFELIGLCTDICVISNALILRAQFPNSEIIVHADCCAGTTPEKHKAALEVMKSCQIIVKRE